MLYTGKLLHAELYDDSAWPYTNVKEVWETQHSKHPGRCIVTNAHWHDPGPKYIGNYKIAGQVLSEDYPEGQWGFGWNDGDVPEMHYGMGDVDNFVSTIPALRDGVRQWLDYGGGVTRSTTRTWLGVDKTGAWTVEVTTDKYTLLETVKRMERLGIVDGMVFDGSGSSQWYDGENRVDGDGRTVFSYLILWFAETGGEPEEGETTMFYKRGIDVSEFQGEVDWEKVKASGVVDFVMLKCGSGQSGTDPMFKRNADECTRLGIPFGVYFFSYAYTPALARKEARRCLSLISPYKLSYPVAWDYEYASYNYSVNTIGITPTRELVSNMARAFLEEIEAAGHYAALYANPDYISRYFDSELVKRYDIWLAQWQGNDKKPEDKPAQAGGMWQYSNQGNAAGTDVPGVPARVDLDYAYYDYPKLIGYTPEPEEPDQPEEPEEEDEPMTWEEEQAAATEWVVDDGLSDGERPEDGVKRIELWVTLWRFYKTIRKLLGKEST